MIFSINGSPRKEATDYVLSKAEEMLREDGLGVKNFHVKGKEINFCIHCDYCLENDECVFDDDMEEVYSSLPKTDGIIIATPVYNGGVSAQVKAVMDRTRALFARNSDAIKENIGMGIAVGGDRAGGQEMALTQIHSYFILNGAVPVSGGTFGANLGATFWSRDSRKKVKEDEEGLKSLKKTIERFKEFLDKYG